MFIPIILGTGRKGRRSIRAAKLLKRELIKRGIDTEIIDVMDYAPCFTPEKPGSGPEKLREYADKITRSDAIIMVVPEYNHSFPGELKILLDSLYEEYNKKPVGICSVSTGACGGRCVIDALRPVVTALGMIPIKSFLVFSHVETNFDEEGNPKDEKFYSRVDRFLKEIIWFAKAIRYAVEHIEM